MKLLRNIFLIVVSLLICILVALIIYVQYNREEIKAEIIASLNAQLIKKVKVKTVELSIFDNFPNVSLSFKEILVSDKKDTLLSFNKLTAKFNLIDVYNRNYLIKGLEFSDGILNIIAEKDYKNYLIWNSTDSSELDFQFELKNLKSKNIELYIKNEETEFYASIKDLLLKGKVKKENISFSLKGKVNKSTLFSSKNSFKLPMEVDLDAIGNWDERNEMLLLSSSRLHYNEIDLTLKGALDVSKSLYVDIQYSTKPFDLNQLDFFLGNELKKFIKEKKIHANLALDGNLKGFLVGHNTPKLNANYRLEKGQIQLDSIKIQKVQSSGKLILDEKTSALKIDTILAELESISINGSGEIFDLNNPYYHIKATAKGNLNAIESLMKQENSWSIAGAFESYVELEGALNKVNSYNLNEWKKYDQSVFLELQDVSLKHKDTIFLENTYALIEYQNGQLKIDSLNTFIRNQKIIAKAEVSDFNSFFDESNRSPIFNGRITSPIVIIDNWINWPKSDEESTKNIPTFYLDVETDQVKYQDFNGSNVKASIIIRNEDLLIKSASFDAFNGRFIGDLEYYFGEESSSLKTNFEGENVKINLLFNEFKNFGQNTITDENLYGNTNIINSFYCSFNEDNSVNSNSITSNTKIQITNGRLKDFEPIYQLSKYIDLEELKDIRFDTLKNQILIKDEVVFIPQFEIKNSALDVIMEGRHQFDNQVDYRFTLYLNELLGIKVKANKNQEMGYIQDDGLGRSKIFIRMTGDVKDPDFKYDKDGLMKHWGKELKEEKKEIKSILNKEFGLFKKDTTLNKEEEEKNKPAPFQVEWDENKNEPTEKKTTPEEKKSDKKGKVGKFIDKIAKPNEEEFVNPPKFD